MSVVALGTEHHIRGACSAKFPEVRLDSLPMRRRPSIRYVENHDLGVGTGTERRQRVQLLGLTLGIPA